MLNTLQPTYQTINASYDSNKLLDPLLNSSTPYDVHSIAELHKSAFDNSDNIIQPVEDINGVQLVIKDINSENNIYSFQSKESLQSRINYMITKLTPNIGVGFSN